MFYMLTQNNSHGVFHVNDRVCHHMIIEARNEEEALQRAEQLGCYWDGVQKGIDCDCCGNRWYRHADHIDLHRLNSKGYEVEVYGESEEYRDEWCNKYGKYSIVEAPHVETPKWTSIPRITGRIGFKTIEDYAQFLAEEYGRTFPDTRIFYRNGSVKEFNPSKNTGFSIFDIA